jgi:biopolymer transport protein ExbD
MRVGARHPKSGIPQVDLVAMMDVLMTVVTFFVVLSMTLNGQQVGDIKLPEDVNTEKESTQSEAKLKPFLLGINSQGQLVHEGNVIPSTELVKALQTYFKEKPEGTIMVLADKSLSYRKVSQILQGLRKMGGKEVALGVQPYEEKSK